MVEITSIGGFILLALNIWAFISILTSRVSIGKKVIWCLLVLLLPLLGFIVWLVAGPRGSTARAERLKSERPAFLPD